MTDRDITARLDQIEDMVRGILDIVSGHASADALRDTYNAMSVREDHPVYRRPGHTAHDAPSLYTGFDRKPQLVKG